MLTGMVSTVRHGGPIARGLATSKVSRPFGIGAHRTPRRQLARPQAIAAIA
jgi:hypothetical protein